MLKPPEKLYLMIQPLVLLVLLLALSSCAQKLPVPEAGSGRIGVVFQTANATTYPFTRAIELQNSNSEEFSVRITRPPLNGEIALSQPLAPGRYMIDSYATRVVPVPGVMDWMRVQSGVLPAPIQIDLRDGEIFMLPVGFIARQYNRAGYTSTDIGWQELDAQSLEMYRRQLAEMENASLWKIRLE